MGTWLHIVAWRTFSWSRRLQSKCVGEMKTSFRSNSPCEQSCSFEEVMMVLCRQPLPYHVIVSPARSGMIASSDVGYSCNCHMLWRLSLRSIRGAGMSSSGRRLQQLHFAQQEGSYRLHTATQTEYQKAVFKN